MCGISAILNNTQNYIETNVISSSVEKSFNKAKHRGPDNSNILLDNDNNIIIGFHRLAINGLNSGANQPLVIDDIILVCNGEIYNYKEIYHQLQIKPLTDSDCEVIIHLYKQFGIDYLLNVLDGVFAFILLDKTNDRIYISRDPYGVRPLFYSICANPSKDMNNYTFFFGSEIKQLVDINNNLDHTVIYPVIPGTYLEFIKTNTVWFLNCEMRYSTFPRVNIVSSGTDYQYYLSLIKNIFEKAVTKRVINSDQPIACLLSGGLDSSIVAAITNKIHNSLYSKPVETYAIGLKGSEDLKYARFAANFLKTKHTELVISEETFFAAIPEVIEKIESYDTTTVRASVGNYLVAKYISENSSAKVILNGDGSDELMGGYLYMQKAPNHIEFDRECKRLLTDIHFFDVLRSDRSISVNGLEARTPFLDRDFVHSYLSISSQIRYQTNQMHEKFLFRKAFEESDLLPPEILWRRKEAFSDGVSCLKRSWYSIIQERVKDLNIPDVSYDFNPPQTLEQKYYRFLFEKNYLGLGYMIPYFWMPKYVDAKDASARTLKLY